MSCDFGTDFFFYISWLANIIFAAAVMPCIDFIFYLTFLSLGDFDIEEVTLLPALSLDLFASLVTVYAGDLSRFLKNAATGIRPGSPSRSKLF